MTKSPHVEIYGYREVVSTTSKGDIIEYEFADRTTWRWRYRSNNGKVLSISSESYLEPRSLVRALELSHPGYHLRDAAQGLTGYGGWYLWPLHNTAETPPIPVRVPEGTVKRWGSRRRR